MERVLVLACRRFDFEDDKGKQVQGATVDYVQDCPESEPGVKGCRPLSISGSLELFDQVTACPGLYDLDFRTRAGKGGKATLKLAGVKLVKAVSFSAAPAAG